MDEEKPRVSFQDNRLYAIALTLITICLCGYLPFALLSTMYAPSNPQYVSPTPQVLQTYFRLQTIFQWGGYLLLPIVILILLIITYKRGNSADNTMTDGSWTTLLIVAGIASTYFWVMFFLYSHMYGYIHEVAGENTIMTTLIGCPSLAFMFPVLALVLAIRPRRKSTWWWFGLLLAFGFPLIFLLLVILFPAS